MKIIHLKETDSTNKALRELTLKEQLVDFTTVITDYQTDGRGQVNNTWVSDRGKNILMSILLRHKMLDIHNQFYISMTVASVICNTLTKYTDNVKIKWPNDIYVGNKKIAGILIDNRVHGKIITGTIAGIGVNINQESFPPEIPNPTSLKILCNKEFNRAEILNNIILLIPYCVDMIDRGEWDNIKQLYMKKLYRNDGEFHMFKDDTGEFEGRITDIAPDGKILLEKKSGELRSYFFKEVEYVL
jgi:BirA family biotin operon repressor/biotin-[acetyl-CoA-carboxylase] ligase